MFHAGDIEHRTYQPMPDLVLFVPVTGNGAGGGPVAVILVHLSYLFFQGHEAEDGVDLLGDGSFWLRVRLGIPAKRQQEQAESAKGKGCSHVYVYFTQLSFADCTSLELPPIMIMKSPASQSYFRSPL